MNKENGIKIFGDYLKGKYNKKEKEKEVQRLTVAVKILEKKLNQKRFGKIHCCQVCLSPQFLWKVGDGDICFSCKQLFSLSHDEVMKGDYQTRFTSGIHRQALGFANHNSLEEREICEKKMEKIKEFANEVCLHKHQCGILFEKLTKGAII